MLELQLSPRNTVALKATFAVITIGLDHLASAYVDTHHVELDELQKKLSALRDGALESSRESWSDIDAAQMLARLIISIEEAEPETKTEEQEDGEPIVVTVKTALEVLRRSTTFISVKEEALPLALVMAADGTAYMLRKLQRDQAYHSTQQDLWSLACFLVLDGDVAKYLGEESASWPPIKGDTAARYQAVKARVEVLEQLPSTDVEKLARMLERHRDASQLSEDEEGN